MKDEINRFNIPDKVLISISDLTAGALNYYKAIEAVKCRQEIIISHIINQQKIIDYLEDIVANTELSDEIKKADEMSKRTLYKWNFQRLMANQRLQKENDKLKKIMKECSDRIMKELNENNHLSYGPALSVNYKLTHYAELKEGVK